MLMIAVSRQFCFSGTMPLEKSNREVELVTRMQLDVMYVVVF